MSFDDFLNRPKHEIETIIRIVDETDKKRNRISSDILKDLEKAAPSIPPLSN